MNNAVANIALAWLLTYAVHSTLLIGLAWIISRRFALSAVTRDVVWKVALVGGIVTSLAQSTLGVQPKGSYALISAAPVVTPSLNSSNTSGSNVNADVNRNLQQPANAPSVRTSKNFAVPPATPPFVAAQNSKQTSNASSPAPTNRVTPASYAVLAWALVAFVLSCLYFARRLMLVGRLANRQRVEEGPMPAMLDALCRKVGHRSTIVLTSVNTISSPVALGLHEICLPEAALTDLEADQQQSLLAHELAHLVRRDPIWLYASSLLEQLFFFQPLNRVARKALQQNAEYLCDDWAAERTGSGLPLAHCLARVADWMVASPLGVPVAGMAEQRSLLVARVARLIDGKSAGTRTSRVAVGVGAVVLLATTVAAAPGVQNRTVQATPLSYWSARSGVKAAALDSSLDRVTASRDQDSSAPAIPAARVQTPSRPILPLSDAIAPEDPVVIAALIERLKDTDAGVRRAAASSLGRLKSRRAVTPLLEVLSDRNKDVRVAAIEALGELEDPAAVPALARLISDESPDVRRNVLEALSNFSESLSAAQILPALADTQAEVRGHAAQLLGEIGDHSAANAVARLLSDQSPDVRQEALQALEHIGDRSSGASILGLLKDDNADVRSSAISALRELKIDIPERTLLSAFDDTDADVRRQAIEYVKDHPSDANVPVLTRLLQDVDGNVRENAVDALGEIRSPAARAAIRGALKSDDAKVRQRAAELLGDRS